MKNTTTQHNENLAAQLRLYAVTDSRRGDALERAVEAALRGGATMLQLRAKGMGDAALTETARRLLAITERYAVPLLLNDRADIAVAVGAAGAHLGLTDGDLRQARALLGPGKILGATARTVEQALAAEAAGADYLGSGAVFGSTTKADATQMPLPLLQSICAAVQIPVVAIGGIDAGNIGQLKGNGVAGYAIVGGIFGADDIEKAAQALRRQIDGA